jgi:hypothetical protein
VAVIVIFRRRAFSYLGTDCGQDLECKGIESKRKNDLNDSKELAALADNIKQIYSNKCKAAYNNDDVDTEDPAFNLLSKT